MLGVGLAVLLVGAIGGSLTAVTPVGLDAGGANAGGNVTGIGRLVFTKYLFAFELTSALLITAALGAMVLTYGMTRGQLKPGQRATVEARLRGEHDRISPLPGPGVFATGNSVAVPALLPGRLDRPRVDLGDHRRHAGRARSTSTRSTRTRSPAARADPPTPRSRR